MAEKSAVLDNKVKVEAVAEREEEEVDEIEDLYGNKNENDDDEEDEGEDEYEKDGFMVNDVHEEEEDDGEEGELESDEERQKKKKRKKREEIHELDEDDHELLKDNNIMGFHRPTESQKFKHLKKAQGNAEGEPSGFSCCENDFDRSGKVGRTAEEKLKQSVFDEMVRVSKIIQHYY